MIGSVVAGRYEVSALVAEGPIFTLVRARDRITGRDMSLRLLKSPFDGQAAFVDQLQEAVRKVSPISHPNVERLIELDRFEGKAYIVGEWTQAPALADRIRKLAPFSVPVAVAAALSVARGLDAFHKAGLVHGDVGPDTTCLMADGEVRLQMGGLWEAYSSSPTAGAIVLPSLAPALAPEVGKGAMPSLRSDVYAVGVLLYELLTGRKPYHGDTPLATAMRHSTEPTPRVRGLNPSVPVALDEIVAKAMEKDPEARYANAGELAADLRLVQDALRFGRTLTWPLRPTPSAPAPPTKAARPSKPANHGRVAPKMSAIRDDEDEVYGKPERDVPAWASLGLALVVCVAGSLLAVYFVLNLNRPRLVSVPVVQGSTLNDARESIQKAKLQFKVGSRTPSEKVEADHVIGTEPAGGTRAREGATITAEISDGPDHVVVPAITGMTPDTARSQLEKVGLRLDDSNDSVNKTGAKDGTIIDQKPKAKTNVPRESLVRATVQDSTLTDPSTQRFEYTVNVDLIDLQDSAQVRIEVEDVDGKRDVQTRRRKPGDTFEIRTKARGDRATFRIYYDDRLVKTIVQRSDGTTEEP